MWKQWKPCKTLFSWSPKSLQMVTGAIKLPGTVDCSILLGFPCRSAGKESTCNIGDLGFDPRLKQNQEKQQCTLGASSSFPIKWYTQYLWAILQNWNPTWWEKLKTACYPQNVDLRPEDWWCWLPLSSPFNQKNVHELITPYLNLYY